MRKKRILAGMVCAALAVLLSLAAGPPARAEETGGKCGDKLTWTLDNAGTLTISGTGAMYSYNDNSEYPWYGQRDAVKYIVLNEGVSSIGKSAFEVFTNLSGIRIAGTVSYIGESAFYRCTSLQTIAIPSGVSVIYSYTFQYCSDLRSIVIPRSVVEVYGCAFEYCNSLEDVYYTGKDTMWNSISIGGYNSPLKDAEKHYNYNPNSGTTYQINGVTVQDMSGNALDAIPKGDFLATVSLTNVTADGDALVCLASYTAQGQYQGLVYVSADNLTPGATFRLTVPVQNAAGNIAEIRAFLLSSEGDFRPLGNVARFPTA